MNHVTTLIVEEKRTVSPGRGALCCLKFYFIQLDLLLEVDVGSLEGILEFDQMLPAKLDIYYLKQFIMETL